MSQHHGRLNGLLSIPKDSLTPLLQMLIAGRFKFVDMGGTKLRYREALARSFRLETHIDADDIPSAGDQAARVVLARIKHLERYGLKSWIEAAKKRLHPNVLRSRSLTSLPASPGRCWLRDAPSS